MNASQAKQIPIDIILAHYGYFPAKRTSKETFYRIDQNDKNPSLTTSIEKNVWKNWQTGEGGNVIDFVMKKNNSTFNEALEYMSIHFENGIRNSHQNYIPQNSINEIKPSYTINEVKPLENIALINYLKSRKIDENIAKKYCKEIYWTNSNGKNLYAVAFENIAQGYEVRNSFYKGNLKRKQISHINNNSNIVKIFEGFIDFLSYYSVQSQKNATNSDYIILNSVTMVQQLNQKKELYTIMNQYDMIECYMDNDNSGKECYEKITAYYPNAIDRSNEYEQYNDYNEYINKRKL